MNTPDTEWEKQVCKACGGDGFTVEYDPRDQTGNTPMQVQCDYCHAEGEYMTLDEVRSLLSSRDTYWKERVGIAYEQGRYDEAQAFDKVMQTPITNEDNLK